jgi:hypothetical protein
MKVWTNTNFEGVWPTSTAAVVVAETAERAAELLNEELVFKGLKGEQKAEDMHFFQHTKEFALVLCDGNY